MYNAKFDKEDNGIGKRIAAARKLKKITAQQLCDKLEQYGISVSRPALGKWERGESVPSAYQIMAVFFAVDIDDPYTFSGVERKPAVLNEQGLQKLENYKADLIASGKYRPYRPAESKCKIIEMPVCRLRASAGTGSFLDEGGFENVSVIAAQVPAGADFGIYISGDSMEPYYHDGNIAWVHECKELSVGDVGIFTYDGNGYIKEYDEQEPDDNLKEAFTDSTGYIHMQPVLRSFNSKYAPKEIVPDAYFQIVGKVLN